MKSFLTLFSALIFSTTALAMKVSCVTEFPTTSVYGSQEGDDFVVRIYHHNGVGFMPLHMGVITPNDLPSIAEKAADFERLGDYYEFRYPLEKCSRFDQDILSCTFGKETKINGISVKPWSFTTMRVSTEMGITSFQETHLMILMEIDGKGRDLSYKYANHECYQEEKAKKIFSVIRR
jgi:hypothetical protein